MQGTSTEAMLGGLVLAGLIAFLLWGIAHEWWRNRRRRGRWHHPGDTASVRRPGLEESDELDLVEDGES